MELRMACSVRVVAMTHTVVRFVVVISRLVTPTGRYTNYGSTTLVTPLIPVVAQEKKPKGVSTLQTDRPLRQRKLTQVADH